MSEVKAHRPPSDFELLRTIYESHGELFATRAASGIPAGQVFVPLDMHAIAARLEVDVNLVFGRLYYHFEPKYGVPPEKPGDARISFFSMIVGKEANCVNFPLLEAVLAGLWVERRRDLWTFWTATVSVAIALAALIISIITAT